MHLFRPSLDLVASIFQGPVQSDGEWISLKPSIAASRFARAARAQPSRHQANPGRARKLPVEVRARPATTSLLLGYTGDGAGDTARPVRVRCGRVACTT